MLAWMQFRASGEGNATPEAQNKAGNTKVRTMRCRVPMSNAGSPQT